ncbi:hypothetical protein PT300_13475 [Enterobacteriaceae bacterium ESL0689]|nr:hypothetical protein [Enterobacteriaceae bacterium ESL0689]
MTERGMIFNTGMVQAILDGRKTQTRRVIQWKRTRFTEIAERDDGSKWPWSEDCENCCDYWHPCPFGSVGDKIWVRETFNGYWLNEDEIQEIKEGISLASTLCDYKADYPDKMWPMDGWTPSIHMPRWASRILLEIKDVRVERLKDISEEDARAEGVIPATYNITPPEVVYRVSFSEVWRSIYGDENWQANPWVWVIKFRRIDEVTTND